jgi:hypothetical protein
VNDQFDKAREHDSRIREVARELARALVYESESGRSDMSVSELLDAIDNGRSVRREPRSVTERYAQEAVDDNETVRDEIDAPDDRANLDQVRHQSEPTTGAALRQLAREVNRERGFDSEERPFEDTDVDAIVDKIVARMRDRRGR